MPSRTDDPVDRQIAALPLRLGTSGVPELLLVTSRGTKRWIIPKGGRMKGLKDHEAAAVEAAEEAGVRGPVRKKPGGFYTYWRRADRDFRLTKVDVFVLKVEGEAEHWKEIGQRERRWVDVLMGADLVDEPELSSLSVRLSLEKDTIRFLAK